MPYAYTFTKELEQFGLCSFKLNLTDSDSILPELNIPVIFKHEEHTEEAMIQLALRIIAEQVQLEEDRKIAAQLELERLAAEKLEAERLEAERLLEAERIAAEEYAAAQLAAEQETIVEDLSASETIVEDLSATETTTEESPSTIEEQI
jgi:hypothetical protein